MRTRKGRKVKRKLKIEDLMSASLFKQVTESDRFKTQLDLMVSSLGRRW